MNADIVMVIRTASLQGKSLDALRRELRGLAKPGRRLMLDLSGVEKANTGCASMILELAARMRENGGTLKLIGLRRSVAAFFELLRVHRSVEMHTSHTELFAMPLAA